MEKVKSSGNSRIVWMVWVGLMAAVICVLGPIAIPIPVSPVPISLATLVIYLFSYFLDWKGAVLGCLVYILLGTAGLPVFTGFSGGLAKLAGPTGGYLVGYLFLAAFCGLFIQLYPQKRALHLVGMILGTAFLYGFGTVWLIYQMRLTFVEGLAMAVLPYLPGDTIKIIIALTAGPVIRERLKKAKVGVM